MFRQSIYKYHSFPLYCLLFVSILTIYLYLPGAYGPFLYDDIVNISVIGENGGINNIKSALDVIFGNSSGPLGRPVSVASFILNAQNWPASPFYFKITNVFLHLTCGLLLYLFYIKLLDQIGTKALKKKYQYIALVATSFWLVHPFHVSTTLYVVQRMTQLSTIFSLLSLIAFLHYRKSMLNSLSISAFIKPSIAIFLLTTMAVFSKENALLIFPAILLIDFYSNTKESSSLYKFWLFLFAILPIVICVAYLSTLQNESVYSFKGFTITQRLLTEIPVVTDYILQILMPNHNAMTIFHDDVTIYNSIFDLQVLLSTIFLAGLASVLFFNVSVVYKFSIAWFFIWHLMESTYLPLDIYFEHRNYTPSIGLLLGLSFGIFKACEIFSTYKIKVLTFLIASYFSVLAIQLSILTTLWSDEESLYFNWLANHEKSTGTLIALVSIYSAKGEIELADTIIDKTLSYQHAENDIAINIYQYTHKCILKKETTVIAKKIVNLTQKPINYTAHVAPVITNLIQRIIKNHCEPTNYILLHNLISQVTENSPQSSSANWLSSSYNWHAQLYLHHDFPQEALDLFIKSYNKRAMTETIVAIIDLNIFLNDYIQAQLWIEKAKKLEFSKKHGVKDITETLIYLQTKLNELLKNNNTIKAS